MRLNVKPAFLFLILVLFNPSARSQSDNSSTDTLIFGANGHLTYQINYQQLFDLSTQRGCSENDFQHYLLYTALYSLFIFLPLEANFHSGVTTLAVKVVKNNTPVLYLVVSLEELLSNSNEPFRIFIHSQALRGLGNCFVVTETQLKAWLLTIGTIKDSNMLYDTNLFDFGSLYKAYFEQKQQVENLALLAPQQESISNVESLVGTETSVVDNSRETINTEAQNNLNDLVNDNNTPEENDILATNNNDLLNESKSINDTNLIVEDIAEEVNDFLNSTDLLNESESINESDLIVEDATETANDFLNSNDLLNEPESINDTNLIVEDIAEEVNESIEVSTPSNDLSSSGFLRRDLFVPENYSLTSFLPSESLDNFSGAKNVLEKNKDYMAVLETTQGRVIIDLLEEQTPKTVNNFIFLARNGYYDGMPFHRVIEDFIAQTGDPTGTGWGGSSHWLELEIVDNLSHLLKGVVSMAGDGERSSGSQFFFTLSPSPELDGQYTIFGKVVEGLDVLQDLQPVNTLDDPSIFAQLQDSLALLAIQGIELDGDEDMTLEDYILELREELPEVNKHFKLDFVDAIIVNDPVIDELFIAFWPMPDTIERLYIVEK